MNWAPEEEVEVFEVVDVFPHAAIDNITAAKRNAGPARFRLL
jgi:hypothetical protein